MKLLRNLSDQRRYTIGFVLSVLLTVAPFYLVMNDMVSGWALTLTLVYFALLQLAVQLVFFLHISSGKDAKWNTMLLGFALLVVVIVVVGTLWIMDNLAYYMGSHGEGHTMDDTEIIVDEGFTPR